MYQVTSIVLFSRLIPNNVTFDTTIEVNSPSTKVSTKQEKCVSLIELAVE